MSSASTLWLAAIYLLKIYTISSVFIFSRYDIKYPCFINLLITVIIELYLISVTGFLDFSSLIIKSITINSYNYSDI